MNILANPKLPDVTAASVPTPPAGLIVVFSEGGKLKQKDSAGTVTDLTAGTAQTTSIASSATPTPTGGSRENELYITAQAVAAAFAAPTGTAVNGNKLTIRIKDDGAAARALTWNAVYRAIGVTMPTTTVAGKTLYLGFRYNSADAVFDCVSVAQQV